MRSVGFYFQHINNYPGACALRAESIIKSFPSGTNYGNVDGGDGSTVSITGDTFRNLSKHIHDETKLVNPKNVNENDEINFEKFNKNYNKKVYQFSDD